MPVKSSILVLLVILVLLGCSTPKSTTIPNYTATRVKVNAGSSQNASLMARSKALEIKNSQQDIELLLIQLRTLRQDILASRIKLAR